MRTGLLAAGIVLLVACATPVSEVAAEPVFDPPPDATEVSRHERPGGGGGFPSTAITVIYAVPHGWQDTRGWYLETLANEYTLWALDDPESVERASILNDAVGAEAYISIQFIPVEDGQINDVPDEAIRTAPAGTKTFIRVRAEKD